MSAVDGQGATGRPETGVGPGTVSPPDGSAPKRSTNWKFIAAWTAFAITFLLTVVLGIQVVLGTKALG